jgi:surface antigen
MKFSTLAPISLLAILGLVSAVPHPTEHHIKCLAEPVTTSEIIKVYHGHDEIEITCQTHGSPHHDHHGPHYHNQTHGTPHHNASIWSKTSDSCYIPADHPIINPCPGPHLQRRAVPGPLKDDYPYKGKCGKVDKWNYYTCQCTSFVAWRINNRLNIHFTNRYKGHSWGNANTWDEAARASGVKINSTPKPGCIAQTNAGSAGHVAWVHAVSSNGKYVTVEEYNWNNPLKYGVRKTLPKSKFNNYIHLTSTT